MSPRIREWRSAAQKWYAGRAMRGCAVMGGMGLEAAVFGIVLALYGVMLLAGAQLIYCLQEMERNSFRIANAVSLPRARPMRLAGVSFRVE